MVGEGDLRTLDHIYIYTYIYMYMYIDGFVLVGGFRDSKGFRLRQQRGLGQHAAHRPVP